MSPQDLCKSIFPDGEMLGLKQLYDNQKPFQNPASPTISEIDNWNIAVINHLRDLVGVSKRLNGDRCLFLTAQLGVERRDTTIWDTKYATDACKHDGKWYPHCGFGWVPDAADQTPYLNGQTPCKAIGAMSEGVFGMAKTSWGYMMAYLIKDTICSEGFTGHGGPLINADSIGIAWQGSGGSVRLDWIP